MANEPTFKATPSNEPSTSGEFGLGGKPVAHVNHDDGGATMDFPVGYKKPAVGEEKVVEAVVEEALREQGDAEVDDRANDESTDTALEELGEYKPDDEAVQAKFDARYFKNGELNLDALSREFFANKAKVKDGEVAKINPATDAYLKEQLGLSEPAIRRVEAALEALNEKADVAFYERVGGREKYDQALEWGKANYTPSQRQRFNALRAKGGEDFLDAVEALMARHDKAVPAPATRRGPPQAQQQERRRSSPERTATGTGSAPAGDSAGGERFSSLADYGEKVRAVQAEHRNAKTQTDKNKLAARLEAMRASARKQNLK